MLINKFKESDNASETLYLIKYTYRFALGPLQFGKYSGKVSTACLEMRSSCPRKEHRNIQQDSFLTSSHWSSATSKLLITDFRVFRSPPSMVLVRLQIESIKCFSNKSVFSSYFSLHMCTRAYDSQSVAIILCPKTPETKFLVLDGTRIYSRYREYNEV